LAAIDLLWSVAAWLVGHLADFARSPNAREVADVGEVQSNPAPVSAATTQDHAPLGGSEESHLKNPLRETCTVGSVRGEN